MTPEIHFKAPRRPVSRVFLHCSASDRPEHDRIDVIRTWHLKRGFSGIGYHFFLRKSGLIERGRDLEKIPAAQEGHNTGTIAICLGGLSDFTEAQFESLRALCAAIHAELPMATFHGHNEINKGKACPVFSPRAVLGLNARGELT